ncbi:sigma-54-dependent transcriptional regulator [Spiribacter halobius]|uniref:Transcriptional regulator n=1 Tax=Sediminicurvatus halobius TaxID=2182432 RepID=A0A2U2MZ09_9GAMM|nr:sigma-54 dependent transcriptional regulator [Spiribacter halobius]PWG62235.1 transcriptional regulator [Spiribacter halobius]UEX78145.1 sigma-54 dependent transcriptional regulator [Spiribacter halobius]
MTTSHVLVVDDEPDIRELVQEILEDEGYEVATADSAAAARQARRRRRPDLVLLDIWMPHEDGITLLKEWAGEHGPDFPVVMISGHGTVETAVEATRLGAVDFVEKPLSMGKLLVTVQEALARGRRSGVAASQAVIEPVGHSQVMRGLRERAARVAASDSWVLISGEAGSGRKCLARYLHSLSPRAQGPLVELAAGAIAGDGAAEELFGRERPGTPEHPGRLEAARGGTLILDEVADLDAEAQTRLISAIEAGRFQRVGGTAEIALDLRLIALTRHDLAEEVRAGRFREDLYYQLSVVPMEMPPLRQHVEDIPELLSFYVDRLVDQEHLPYRRFSVAAQNRLRNHAWPGNVRELRNLVQRLLVLGEGVEIGVDEVERALGETTAEGESGSEWPPELSLDLPLREAREAFERTYLQHQLKRAEGSVAQLARLTGMERTHLYRKLRALGIDPKEGA